MSKQGLLDGWLSQSAKTKFRPADNASTAALRPVESVSLIPRQNPEEPGGKSGRRSLSFMAREADSTRRGVAEPLRPVSAPTSVISGVQCGQQQFESSNMPKVISKSGHQPHSSRTAGPTFNFATSADLSDSWEEYRPTAPVKSHRKQQHIEPRTGKTIVVDLEDIPNEPRRTPKRKSDGLDESGIPNAEIVETQTGSARKKFRESKSICAQYPSTEDIKPDLEVNIDFVPETVPYDDFPWDDDVDGSVGELDVDFGAPKSGNMEIIANTNPADLEPSNTNHPDDLYDDYGFDDIQLCQIDLDHSKGTQYPVLPNRGQIPTVQTSYNPIHSNTPMFESDNSGPRSLSLDEACS
ncbi:hypothetical protein BJ742DRAFT_547995 [Cladochytrium replicatum]|nr:hypothetical protein BJ742DRAFT_547995 [Cladochytrium replicatum]